MKSIIKNISQAIDSNCSTNIRIKQGHDKLVRITAVARFKQDDKDPFFSKWVTYNYANRIYRDLYGKNISESNNFQY
jgi:hypothetical protein